MKHTVTHKGIEFYVFRRSPMEFVPVVIGVPLGFSPTIEGAEKMGREAIDAGARSKFKTTFTWPDGNQTTKDLDLGRPINLLRFQELLWRSMARGATVTIESRES